MKGSAKLVMGATLILVVSLAIVLALILVLLAELYCSLLFRKRRYRTNTATTATTTPAATSPQASLHSSTTSVQLSNVYAHGVFLAPRNILYPSIVHKQEEEICKNQQKHQFFKPYDHQSHHHQVLEILNLDPNNTPSPFSSLTASPATMQQIHHQEVAESEITAVRVNIGSSVCGSAADKHLVYISNPIYDNELSYKHSGVAGGGGGGGGGESGICSNATPFETPESSPSHLEMDWEEEDRRNEKGSSELSPNSSLETMTPPLTPMKKLLPMEACSSVSVSLRDARSIDTSGSSHGLSCSSSLSTSPSWCD
ncbi:probable serine/threonine-protein kinase DDB_G0272282 [Papaver somniferum]|uniref:probable serine/threonine-protein kinase DDB_G0272282 n=1 Tax=Papaver somniferum TaxID=3469 RepID=UPI000E6FD662|nr:probable serine/threonine-protein kinase DDB_G0272282 [Papaver somniferum]